MKIVFQFFVNAVFSGVNPPDHLSVRGCNHLVVISHYSLEKDNKVSYKAVFSLVTNLRD